MIVMKRLSMFDVKRKKFVHVHICSSGNFFVPFVSVSSEPVVTDLDTGQIQTADARLNREELEDVSRKEFVGKRIWGEGKWV